MKVCTKCKRELPLSAFGKRKQSKDGLQYMCKECKSKQAKKYWSHMTDEEKLFKKYRRQQKREQALVLHYREIDYKSIGGYKMFILNHTKQGEYKYNAVNTVTQEVFKTNNKDEFIKFLSEI